MGKVRTKIGGNEDKIFRFESKRLFLKRLEVEDITEDYVRWINDSETTKYLEVRFYPQTRESVEHYVKNRLLADSKTYHLGVFDQGGCRLVGTVTFNHIEVHHLSASISFVIGLPGCQEKGYATEAVHAATNYMFSRKNFMKIWGGYYSDHKASERVFLKNGYRIEGHLRGKLMNYQNERVGHIYVGILSDEFKPDRRFLGTI